MEHTLALSHGTLSWDAFGSRRAAVTIVLLHGFPHDRGLWAAQAGAAADVFPDVRLLIPDLPGFGRSSPLSAAGMDAYADVLEPMLDRCEVEQAVIGGLSMGGYIAFAFWRRHAARTRALMLFGTKAPADTEAARDARRALIDTVQRDGVGALVPSMISTQLGVSTRRDDPALVEQIEVMLHRAPVSGVTAAAEALMGRVDSTPTLDTILVPTLVLVGDEDTITPVSDAMRIAAGIPRSRLVTVPGAGHLAPIEQPAVVNAAIAEFLDVSVR